MLHDRCKSTYKGIQCDVLGKSPHTHHAFLHKEIDEDLWWSNADEISELREWVKEILDANNLRSGY